MTPPQLPSLPMSGAVDADGHILEAPDLWETYLEAQYRDRAVRIRKDADGLEYLEVNGRPCKMVRRGAPSSLGVMDQLGGFRYEREPTGSGYVDNASFGSMDPTERLQRLDIENIERAFLYPTLGLLWEPECEDLELSMAYARAYNRWIVDFCSDSGGPPDPDCPYSVWPARVGRGRAAPGGHRRRQRIFRPAVYLEPQGSRPSRPPPHLCRRPGAGPAVRDSSVV